jgi:hypothetical protein
MENKIIENTEKTINDSLAIGQMIINGNMRIFKISNLTETEVELTSINGETEKRSVMSRKVFSQLFYRKNYTQVKNETSAIRDFNEAGKIGSNRLLVK